MLEWFKIENYNSNLMYRANVENGVKLPELEEEVLFCGKAYTDESKDLYFSGRLRENARGCYVVWPKGDISDKLNGLYWAKFNRPFTENNTRFCIAYLDEDGHGFNNKYPNIIKCKPNDFLKNYVMLKSKGCSKITYFKCIEPVTFEYDWSYINDHKATYDDVGHNHEIQ